MTPLKNPVGGDAKAPGANQDGAGNDDDATPTPAAVKRRWLIVAALFVVAVLAMCLYRLMLRSKP